MACRSAVCGASCLQASNQDEACLHYLIGNILTIRISRAFKYYCKQGPPAPWTPALQVPAAAAAPPPTPHIMHATYHSHRLNLADVVAP